MHEQLSFSPSMTDHNYKIKLYLIPLRFITLDHPLNNVHMYLINTN